MLAIYDWLGSLDLYPEHFSLHVQPAITISPQDKAVDFHSIVIYVETLPMSFTSPEVNFKGFGGCGRHLNRRSYRRGTPPTSTGQGSEVIFVVHQQACKFFLHKYG